MNADASTNVQWLLRVEEEREQQRRREVEQMKERLKISSTKKRKQ
jgi:hypothetical protein